MLVGAGVNVSVGLGVIVDPVVAVDVGVRVGVRVGVGPVDVGVGGGGEVAGSPSAHYSMVEDTCVACHLGEGDNHTFEPEVASCHECHADIEDFDVNGTQTEVIEKLETLEGLLVGKGMWDEEEGHPVVGFYPAAEAQALWNYIMLSVEDSSDGVNNPAYTRALLEASIESLQ